MNNFFIKYKFLFIILLTLVIMFISYNNYQRSNVLIENNYEKRQKLVERNIVDSIIHVDQSLKIADNQLNMEMRKYSQVLLDKYKDNPNVKEWNLEELKKEFVDYEIFIVNSDLKVTATTYAPDLGLDFNRFPSFAESLRQRLKGDSLVIDRLDLSINTGEFKKYSYQPTPDNQYLLELSVDILKRFPALKDLKLFRDVDNLIAEYEIVEDIGLYRVDALQGNVSRLSNEEPFLYSEIPEYEAELASNAAQSNQMQSRNIQANGSNYIHNFFPAIVEDSLESSQGWASYIVGIQYNESVMQADINFNRNLFLINSMIMFVILLIFIGIVIYLLQNLENQAYHDQLTGLANRDLVVKSFSDLKEKAKNRQKKIGILFLDIDNFKEINDNYGHDVGDKVLKEVADLLSSSLRSNDKLFRLGGDEFVITVTAINSMEEIKQVAKRIVDAFKEPLIVDQSNFFISVSLGISIYPEHGQDLSELLKNADNAMYRAKQQKEDYILYEDFE
ncbi:GGDEF domain-containing protein [Halanaerobium hydrogeniformans]|uniref:GGDEF domain-containing protein n=1 Tax=Halanaerobium hydrogeniformans TaxID=656519 RepID=UPI0005A1A98B|nr:GGDEF domain-containing protein [Halanaerobium hydrogeniformans]